MAMKPAAVSSLRTLCRARDRIDRDYADQIDIPALAAGGARDRRDGGVHHPSPLHRGDRRQGLEAAAGRAPGPFGIKDLLRPATAAMCVVPGKTLL